MAIHAARRSRIVLDDLDAAPIYVRTVASCATVEVRFIDSAVGFGPPGILHTKVWGKELSCMVPILYGASKICDDSSTHEREDREHRDGRREEETEDDCGTLPRRRVHSDSTGSYTFDAQRVIRACDRVFALDSGLAGSCRVYSQSQ